VNSQENTVLLNNTLVRAETYQYNSLRLYGTGGDFLAFRAPDQGVTFHVQVGQNVGLLGINQYYPYSVSDGSGGSISASLVLVHPVMSSSLIYDILNIQRSDYEGSPVWQEKQVFSSHLVYEIISLKCTTDGNGCIMGD
jgi:hypothetical protein